MTVFSFLPLATFAFFEVSKLARAATATQMLLSLGTPIAVSIILLVILGLVRTSSASVVRLCREAVPVLLIV